MKELENVSLKYLLLSKRELESEKDGFINYLALHGIDAKHWETIKKEDPTKVDAILNDFSNGVWDARLNKIEFVNAFSENSVVSMRFTLSEMVILGLKSQLNLLPLKNLSEKEFAQWVKENSANLSTFKSLRKFETSRNEELFALLKTGVLIADNRLFDYFSQLNSKET